MGEYEILGQNLEFNDFFKLEQKVQNISKKRGLILDNSKYDGVVTGLPFYTPYIIRKKRRIMLFNNSVKIKALYYNGYKGTVVFSKTDNVYYGKILNINDSVSYEGNAIEDLIEDFHNAVDEYMELCISRNTPT